LPLIFLFFMVYYKYHFKFMRTIFAVILVVLTVIAAYYFFDQLILQKLPIFFSYNLFPFAVNQQNQPKTPFFYNEGSASVYKPKTNPLKVINKSTNTTNTTPSLSPIQTNEPNENKKDPEALSPYFEKVRISEIRNESYYYPSLIGLTYYLDPNEKINLTGWKVKGRQGEIIIPKAIKKYQPYFQAEDVIVENYGTIYLINAQNPLGINKNFQLNKCMGYLTNYYNFYPSFFTSCSSYPQLSQISYLNPECQEFILRLSNCEIPDYSKNSKIAMDSQCVSYLNSNFNYDSCFKKYSNDSDFLLNIWYLYVGGSNIAHPLHDTLYIFDQKGLLVYKYIY